MTSLLDTNVVSEWLQARPNPAVIAWLKHTDTNSCCISVVTLAEIRTGIERLPAGARRLQLEHWLEIDLPRIFGDYLPIDDLVADICGRIRADGFKAGRPIAMADALIAATAESRDLTLVTRNVRDFAGWGGRVFNPWDA